MWFWLSSYIYTYTVHVCIYVYGVYKYIHHIRCTYSICQFGFSKSRFLIIFDYLSCILKQNAGQVSNIVINTWFINKKICNLFVHESLILNMLSKHLLIALSSLTVSPASSSGRVSMVTGTLWRSPGHLHMCSIFWARNIEVWTQGAFCKLLLDISFDVHLHITGLGGLSPWVRNLSSTLKL